MIHDVFLLILFLAIIILTIYCLNLSSQIPLRVAPHTCKQIRLFKGLLN